MQKESDHSDDVPDDEPDDDPDVDPDDDPDDVPHDDPNDDPGDDPGDGCKQYQGECKRNLMCTESATFAQFPPNTQHFTTQS